jgi:protein-L-isoaspartate(D-aspartate) O-methyltransferase
LEFIMKYTAPNIPAFFSDHLITGAAEFSDTAQYRRLRHDMVRQQIVARGVRHAGVARAMARLPRHFFIRQKDLHAAYDDHAMTSDCGQTISQPLMVAVMSAQLAPQRHDRILEIGTGTGYQTAVLAMLCQEVFTIELIPELSAAAQQRLVQLGFKNIHYGVGDGSMGWKNQGPFNGILVAAGAPAIPEPLLDQLTADGKLVIPIGTEHIQMLKRIERRGQEITETNVLDCRFVPLRGQFGWH